VGEGGFLGNQFQKMIATGVEMTLSRHGESKMPEKKERQTPTPEQEEFIRPDLTPGTRREFTPPSYEKRKRAGML